MARELKPITIVPHYMRLHEWIALEEGFFEKEGLAPTARADFMLDALTHLNADKGRGDQVDYVEGSTCTSSACEWGVIRNAGAGKGKVLTSLYSVAPYAIYTRPDSDIWSLTDLRGRRAGVMLRSGTHFTTLKALDLCVPDGSVEVVGTGGAGRRIQALLDGKIDAATLLDPERAIAEQMGLRRLAQGEFRVLFYVSNDTPQDLITPFVNAMRAADQELRRNPANYMRLWDKNMRPETRGKFDYAKFGRGELLFFEEYPQALFDEGMAYAKSRGLADDVFNEDYQALRI
jgi:NitT/TauT family transport system substrate-binding protein